MKLSVRRLNITRFTLLQLVGIINAIILSKNNRINGGDHFLNIFCADGYKVHPKFLEVLSSKNLPMLNLLSW